MDLGNGVEINLGKIDYNLASDAELQAAREGIDAVGEARGLWIPEGAGALVVATEVDAAALRSQLLDSVVEGATLFNGAVEAINGSRKKRDQIPVTQAGEYREQAEDWLTEDRVKAAAQLPVADNRPRLVIPRLSQPISHQGVVDSWQAAANGRLWAWSGRMDFLSNWTADQLSGHDPEQADEDRLEVVATAYDADRQGTVAQQKAGLEALQTEFPELDVATIFDGSVLARRYMNQGRDWRDSYVRGITLKPAEVVRFGFVPNASVHDDGGAYVRDSYVDGDYAARLRVR